MEGKKNDEDHIAMSKFSSLCWINAKTEGKIS